jgi:mono/diheme cytochrome c family protein
MTKMNTLAPAAALLVSALAFGAAAQPPAAQTPAGDAANGAKIYVAVGCFTCHGRSGQGGNFNYATPVLAKTQWPVEAFIAFLRVGVNDMPAYAKEVLSDQQVADIHAFLRSLPGSRPPAEIPLLNQ